MSEVNYNCTKGEIWKELKTARAEIKQLKKDQTPTEVTAPASTALAIPTASLAVTQTRVQHQLNEFADLSEERDKLLATLKNVHSVEIKPETLDVLCRCYKEVAATNVQRLAGAKDEHTRLLAARETELDTSYTSRARAIDHKIKRDNLEYKRGRRALLTTITKERAQEERDVAETTDQTYSEIRKSCVRNNAKWTVAHSELAVRAQKGHAIIKEADSVPQLITEAETRAHYAGVAIAKRVVENRKAMQTATNAAEMGAKEAEVSSAQMELQHQNTRIAALQDRLRSTQSSAYALSQASIEGSSDTNALNAVKDIAMKQAGNVLAKAK